MNALLERALQPALAELAIALSVFSLITYLWLGLTVLLAGDRRNMVTWASGVGLLLGAIFFLSHGALVAERPIAGGSGGSATADFWWRLSWFPAFTAPFLWAVIGLRYTQLSGEWRRLRTVALGAVAGLGALTVLLALLSWSSIAHYTDFIRLLDSALRLRDGAVDVTPWVPALGVAFVVYMGACAGLPWAALAVSRLAPTIEARLAATALPLPLLLGADRPSGARPAAVASEPPDRELLWDPADAWERARPALLTASLFMVVAGGVVAVTGLGLVLFERHDAMGAIAQNLPAIMTSSRPGRSPLALVVADLCLQGALAGLGLMLGWAVVRQGVMVERRLPQRGYLSHWRRMAALALAFAAVVAWMGGVEPAALPDLLLLVALVAIAIALVTWQSYVAHDRLLTQLRPFMASLTTGQAGWLATDPGEVERGVDALFTSLCRDVLGAAHGQLAISAGRLSHTFTYTASANPEQGEGWPIHLLPRAPLETREWTLPVTDERGVVALLTLGPRLDGAGYTSADLEIARACGQRILDGVGGFATARAVASLARRRGLEAELTAALPRRTLHDEVLPRLHLAMLRLEALRARLRTAETVPAGDVPAMNGRGAGEGAMNGRGVDGEGMKGPAGSEGVDGAVGLADDLGEVVGELGKAHRDLARLMRGAPLASARRVEHGFTGALRGALDGEFRGVFDELEWEASNEAVEAADALPPIVADLLLGATLEAARNAGRHGRGGELSRRLALRVRLAADEDWVTVEVADDGVGFGQAGASIPGAPSPDPSGEFARPRERSDTGGARSGLLTHGALMALVGGSLAVRGGAGGGAVVAIRAPRSAAG
ncbi:MAG TPA: ATP-binding protein [Ktedonobacterales bacterium]|nr:ATP-binding protein [Ktedonobacterales bacterium]